MSAGADVDRRSRVFESVADEVGQHLVEVRRLAEGGGQRARQPHRHPLDAVTVPVLEHRHHVLDGLRQLHLGGVGLELAGLQLGDDQLALDQVQQAVRHLVRLDQQ